MILPRSTNGPRALIGAAVRRSGRLSIAAAAVVALAVPLDAAKPRSAESGRPSSARGPAGLGISSQFEAARRALELIKQKKFTSSLPLFRRALSDPYADTVAWQLHLAYAEGLNGAAFQVAGRLGLRGPQPSMSTRRITLVREAAAQLDTAERIAKRPREVALIRSRHAHLFEVWGFPVDAYGWYRAALKADPGCEEAALGLLWTTVLLRGGTDTSRGSSGRSYTVEPGAQPR